MRNRRDRRHGNKLVVHITNRTVCGLPFICSALMKMLIAGTMAKAQSLYPAIICHFLWMGNHYHLILAKRAGTISPFVGYFQGELAKYLKGLMPGFYQGDVWADRFREQRLYTSEDVIGKIVYLYANPVRANLVDSIKEYPGLSSYKVFVNELGGTLERWVAPRLIKPIKGVSESTYIKQLIPQTKRSFGIRCASCLIARWKT